VTEAKAKHAALESMKGLTYQAAIALKECFDMDDDHTVWIEKDGDVSVEGETPDDSKQIEAKNYSDNLTDHHTNFWNTLKNWLAPEFNQTQYGALILLTTQPFGSRSKLSEWNQINAEERLALVFAIYDARKSASESADKKSKVEMLQKDICGADSELLRAVLEKVYLRTESDNEDEIIRLIKKRLDDIPLANQESYLQGLVGFVYRSSANRSGLEILDHGLS